MIPANMSFKLVSCLIVINLVLNACDGAISVYNSPWHRQEHSHHELSSTNPTHLQREQNSEQDYLQRELNSGQDFQSDDWADETWRPKNQPMVSKQQGQRVQVVSSEEEGSMANPNNARRVKVIKIVHDTDPLEAGNARKKLNQMRQRHEASIEVLGESAEHLVNKILKNN